MKQKPKPLTSVLIKPAGPDCNMACSYCFYLEKDHLFPEQKVHRMGDDVLKETVRQVLDQGGPSVSFAWQGGEPTLMGLDFFKRAVEFQKELGRDGQAVGNGFQTNGLLIDEAWCVFFHEYRFLVGLSIDGPEHVHDRYRLDRAGGPVWPRVMKALELMLQKKVEVNALTVVNDYSARFPREIYEFHKENGLIYMQFIPCLEPDPRDPEKAAPFSVEPRALGRFLCEVFDCWIEDFRDGLPTTFVRWFDSLFFTYVGQPPPECTLLKECGIYVVVEHNGDVFSCDFFVEPSWKLGNVMEGSLSEMLNDPKQHGFGGMKAELPTNCLKCPWLTHCRGGCTKERLHNPRRRDLSYFCESYKMFFSHADKTMQRLAEKWRQEQRREVVERSLLPKVGRNDPCPCGSGKKWKKCCMVSG
jgi:uncharacterized protein